MALACFAEFHGCFLLLFAAAEPASFRNTRMGHNRRQLFLVLWGMESPIERGPLDLATDALLQLGHRWYEDVLIQLAIGHHGVMADETDRILDHQDLVTILDRIGLFAALDQFGVRLEDAENLLVVGHRFAQEHAASSRAAHLLGWSHIMPQFIARPGQ